MTNRFTILAAATALFIGLSAPAAAAEDMAQIGTVGPWTVWANTTRCKAMALYANGTFLMFWLNTKAQASISIINPEWKIQNCKYNVVAQVDKFDPVTFTATAGDGYVEFPIRLNESDVNRLSYGMTLYVTVGAFRYAYHLDRSEGMLKALTACTAERRITSVNPFNGTAPPASAPPPSAPIPEPTSNPDRRM
jgi:hypothetical protein